MKTLIPLTAIAALAASGLTYAQSSTAAFSTPSGYVTETFKAGEFNLFGLTLNEPPVAAGTLTGVTSSSVSDSTKNFNSLLTTGQTYVVEITQANSTSSGAIAEVTSWNGSTLNTSPTDLTLVGVATNSTYLIRRAPTISDIFGPANEAGLLAGGATSADILWVSNGSGEFIRYYFATSSPPVTAGWRRIGGGNTNSANVPIVFTDGLILQRRGSSDLSVTLTGVVKTSPTLYPVLGNSFNYLGATFPVGSTLDSSGLASQVVAGSPDTADIVWVPDGTGSYTRFYFAAADFPITAGWRAVSGGDTDRRNEALTSGIIIQRRGSSANIRIAPPASYSDL